jgi:hypothetical protein
MEPPRIVCYIFPYDHIAHVSYHIAVNVQYTFPHFVRLTSPCLRREDKDKKFSKTDFKRNKLMRSRRSRNLILIFNISYHFL